MKIHRFIGEFNLSGTHTEITDPKIIKQIKDVLRIKKGDKITLSDGKGKEVEMLIELLSKKSISGSIKKIKKSANIITLNDTRKINLYLAILKKENFELAVQKAVEIGVSSITPVITERTIKTGLNIDRLNKIIREASEQSGRSTVPTLSPILKFQEALEDANGEKIIFHLTTEEYKVNKNAKEVSIFIGPEGGFTEKEIAWANYANFKIASLGPLTLRGETAAIVATYRTVTGI